MNLLGIALLCAVVGVVPLLISEKFVTAVIMVLAAWLVGWGLLYVSTPSTAYPFFGIPGFLVFIFWIIAAVIDGLTNDYDDRTWTWVLPAAAAVIYLGSLIASSGIFRADDYKNMLGPVEERVWTQDVQPKDPKHMRMSTTKNAIYLAKKILGDAGTIGSQFSISESHMTLQMIGKELWYVVPLDYRGISVWTSTDGVPGYIMVSGEDPYRQAIIKTFPAGQKMQYTPGAYFWNDLERHLRNKGFVDLALTDYTFEIDENGKAWWVVTAYKPTIMWSGEKVVGVIIIDPATGDARLYPQNEIPAWVDRALPKSFIKDYLKWNGKYVHGWWNTFWGSKDIVEPEDPILVYGTGDQPEWVTGIASEGGQADSLVALVYTNSRTGKSVRYKVGGGGTDKAVLDAVNKNNQVQLKKIHGADPQIYNVHDTMASIVPLMNESNAFQGVAIVSINKVQIVAVGSDQYEALREYEKIMLRGGQQVVLGKEREIKTIEGVVDRREQYILGSGSTFCLHLSGIPRIFTGGAAELSPKLPLTKEGDRVKIAYYASECDVIPMHDFDNLSLHLVESKDQQEVRQKNKERRTDEEAGRESKTIMENLKQLSPEQLKEIGKQIPKSD